MKKYRSIVVTVYFVATLRIHNVGFEELVCFSGYKKNYYFNVSPMHLIDWMTRLIAPKSLYGWKGRR